MDARQEAERKDDAIGGAMLPAIVAFIIGVYRFVTIGAHWTALVMTVGAGASRLAVSAYAGSKGKHGRTWGGWQPLRPWCCSLGALSTSWPMRASSEPIRASQVPESRPSSSACSGSLRLADAVRAGKASAPIGIGNIDALV